MHTARSRNDQVVTDFKLWLIKSTKEIDKKLDSTINIILSVLEVTDYQLWASDLNQDNVTNILDVVSLVNIILN